MAIRSVPVKRAWSIAGGTSGSLDPFYQLYTEFNNLVSRFDALAAKLDADIGINDTDYQSLHADSNVGQLATREGGD